MRLLIAIVLGLLVLTFAWGWVMDVHYGYMTTDVYAHHYLVCLQNFFTEALTKAHQKFDFFFNPHQPIIRREFALPTV